jgi:hypothetical protein
VSSSPVIAEFDYDMDSRQLWPDDFDRDTARPELGDLFDHGTVTALIDPETGAVVLAMGTIDEGGEGDALTGGTAGGTDIAPADPDWETPDPATSARIDAAAADDIDDPAVVSFLEGSTAEVKMRIRGQLSAQLLRQALEREQSGPNKERPGVVSALEARIAELVA